MRYIIIPNPVLLQTISGDSVVDKDGEPMKLDLFEFIRSRLIDAKFAAPRVGYEAALFVSECKTALDIAKADLASDTFAIENDFWKALVEVTKSPTGAYDPRWAHSMIPIMEPIINAGTVNTIIG